jgi:hypothetical protein
MVHRTLFITQAVLLVFILAVHVVSLENFLYWHYPLLNRAIHFLGGLWVALAAAWVILRTDRNPTLALIMLTTIGIGIAWEIFEVAIGMTSEENYKRDTALDLVMDASGGFLGYLLVPKRQAA